MDAKQNSIMGTDKLQTMFLLRHFVIGLVLKWFYVGNILGQYWGCKNETSSFNNI